MLAMARQLVLDDSAQGLPEYALLVAAVVAMMAFIGWIWTSGDVFSGIEDWILNKNAIAAPPGSVPAPGPPPGPCGSIPAEYCNGGPQVGI